MGLLACGGGSSGSDIRQTSKAEKKTNKHNKDQQKAAHTWNALARSSMSASALAAAALASSVSVVAACSAPRRLSASAAWQKFNSVCESVRGMSHSH